LELPQAAKGSESVQDAFVQTVRDVRVDVERCTGLLMSHDPLDVLDTHPTCDQP